MGINSTEISYAFGQMGSMFNNTASAITPPTGKVFVAITFLEDTTLNTTAGMVADNHTGTTPATAGPGLEYVGVTAAHHLAVGSETEFSGGGGKAVVSTTVFPKGVTVYGRWTKLTTINSGQYIAYIGQ